MPDQKGSHALACFYVRRRSSEITEEFLRQHLSGEMTAYMVPDFLVELEAFPRTPNGKIDTLALKLPEPTPVS